VTMVVSSGGTATGTALHGGTEIVSSGGVIGGAVTFKANSKLSVAAKTGVTLTVSGFAATDTLDLASFKFHTTETLSFVENAAKTKGVLTITDGTLHASITLFGLHVAAGFHLASDGAGGTDITYAPPPAAHLELAGKHT
jgi:large repetitive protein